MTLFEAMTEDESTLAANIVNHSHRSIKEWARRRGIKAEFTTEEFMSDWSAMEKELNREVGEFHSSSIEIAAQ